MNLQQLVWTCRTRLRDLGVKRWHDAELVMAANEAQGKLAHIFRQSREDWFLTSTLTDIPVAAAGYSSTMTLPDDFWELKNLAVEQSGYEDIVFIARDQSNQQYHDALVAGGSYGSGTGVSYYDIYAGTTLSELSLSPGWDVSVPLRITYIKFLTDMAVPEDEPGFPAEFHGFLVQDMVCTALRSEADPRLAAWELELKDETDRIRTALHPRQIREQRHVRGYLEEEEW